MLSLTYGTRSNHDLLIYGHTVVLKRIDGAKFDAQLHRWCSRGGLFFFPVPFLLSQLVAEMNVLVWEMTHPQPEVLRRDRANFSFTFFLSIASISVFIATKTLPAL